MRLPPINENTLNAGVKQSVTMSFRLILEDSLLRTKGKTLAFRHSYNIANKVYLAVAMYHLYK